MQEKGKAEQTRSAFPFTLTFRYLFLNFLLSPDLPFLSHSKINYTAGRLSFSVAPKSKAYDTKSLLRRLTPKPDFRGGAEIEVILG
jgi:hypothetical protein